MARNMDIYFSYKGSANDAIKKWTKDLEKQLMLYKGNLEEKLERVLDYVEDTSQRLIPEDTQAAKNSFYREVVVEGDKIIARAGYDRQGQLPYIVYIHEFKMNFQKTSAERRFLAKGFEQAALNIDRILAEE